MRKRFWMPGLVLFMAFIMSACGAEQKRESAKTDHFYSSVWKAAGG